MMNHLRFCIVKFHFIVIILLTSFVMLLLMTMLKYFYLTVCVFECCQLQFKGRFRLLHTATYTETKTAPTLGPQFKVAYWPTPAVGSAAHYMHYSFHLTMFSGLRQRLTILVASVTRD